MNRLLVLLGIAPPYLEPRASRCKAFDVLHVSTPDEARARARNVLERAHRCPCCQSLLDHVFERIGSTFFTDDDPRTLANAFPENERDNDSSEVLAALIVLEGRRRVAPSFA